MPGSRKWGVTTFNDIWLADECFKRWLKKVPGDSTKALCILCNKKIDIANIGVSALVSHKSFKKHSDKEKVHPLGSMFFTKTAAAVASKSASLSTSNPMMSQTRLKYLYLWQLSKIDGVSKLYFHTFCTNQMSPWSLSLVQYSPTVKEQNSTR